MRLPPTPPGSPSYQGRPIAVEFHSTPQLYVAYFRDEYDGAPDSNHPTAWAVTEEEAVANLIEWEERHG